MPKTSCRVSFGLFDLEFKRESALTSTPLQAFSSLDDLRTDQVSPRAYASYEQDFWVLDGEYKFLPETYETVHVGMMSASMSGAAGTFVSNPQLTVTFSQAHDTTSLSLRFSPTTGDYCSSLTVAYYTPANALIRSDAYTPTSPEFSTGQAVSGFSKIIITFLATSRPYRYLRLTGIDYGEFVTFEGAAIKGANLIEEVNPLTVELPSNEIDLRLYSADADFSIINPAGKYAALAEGQPLDVYEIVDSVPRFMGRFYLDEWENESDTLYHFTAIDMIGRLDTSTYYGGIWLGEGIALSDLLEAMLSPIYVPYELDTRLADTKIIGWLPVSSYREALQQIGFAVGATVSCARSGVIKIFQARIAATETADYTITRTQKGIEAPLKLNPLVTGVEVFSHNFIPGGEANVVMSGRYEPGVHEIIFADPMHSFAVDGATVLESGVNYAKIAVAEQRTVALTGLRYIDTTAVYAINTAGLPARTRPNVVKIENATLVHPGSVQAAAQRVYDYYQQRYFQKLRLFAPSIEPGSVTVVDTLYNRKLRAVVEQLESDLAMGFTSRVEMTGVVHVD